MDQPDGIVSENVMLTVMNLRLGAEAMKLSFEGVCRGGAIPEAIIQRCYEDEMHRTMQHLMALWEDPFQRYYYSSCPPVNSWGWAHNLVPLMEAAPHGEDLTTNT